jgi:uncharacterized membrane protein YhaH (DUF805 family)
MIKNLINNFFKDWVVFDGKLDRKSFLINFSLNLISQIIISLMILSSIFGSSGSTKLIIGFIAFLIYGCLQINFYSLIVRRLHDNNKSGWWVLLFFLSIVFLIGMRQSNSTEENNIFLFLLISSSFPFLYFLLSADKKQKTLKTIRVSNTSLTKKSHLVKNYKIFIVPFLIIATVSSFVFIPYKTQYYKCSDFYETRSLVIKKYLPNNYSIITSNNKLKPFIMGKKLCQSNVDSVGFVCKVTLPTKESYNEVLEVLEVKKKALAAGDKEAVKKLDDYIKTLPHKKYLYRFDPITIRLREVITSSEEGEITNEIYQCEQTENKL